MRATTSTLVPSLRSAATLAIGLVLFLAFQSAATAQTTVYIFDGGTDDFGTLNLSTGGFTKLGNTGVRLEGMGELGNNLYGGTGNTLYQINLSNGSVTAIGNASITYRGFGATTASLYTQATNSNLYSINAATGTVNLIGATGIGEVNSMSANGSTLYATVGTILYSINTNTGAATEIGDTGVSLIGAIVLYQGKLYAGTTSGVLYTLDPLTGAATLVADTGVDTWGLAFPASTYSKLHDFTGGQDGANPYAGVTMDKAGSLYGTAFAGGSGSGTVYKLIHKGSGWTFNPLYSFAGGSDGAGPTARVVLGSDGSLYGTTYSGGEGGCTYGQYKGCGTVFNLKPGVSACKAALCGWSEKVLYSFTGGTDGADPFLGDLVFDQAGNLYGTTFLGGTNGNCGGGLACGTVFELTHSGNSWTESVLWDFGKGNDGVAPANGVIFDQAGNLYGTTLSGGTPAGCSTLGLSGCGTVYQLKPGSPWTETVLHSFQYATDGAGVYAGLVFDPSGNLYGATTADGRNGGGTVFELSAGTWTFSVPYALTGISGGTGQCSNCRGPYGNLILDASGNLYGMTLADGVYSKGSVFKLTPSNGSWIYTDLYDFTGGTDGANPYSTLVFDASGNLYGTAYAGGADGKGVVFKLTPN